MYEREVELTVGDTIRIGKVCVTLLDVDGDELTVKIDHDHDGDTGQEFGSPPPYAAVPQK